MSATFVSGLRARPDEIDIAEPGGPAIRVRVEMPEVWDTVRLKAAPVESVMKIKMAALEALCPEGKGPQEFVVKFRGWEILDESMSLVDAGVVDGSILLMTHRRRRAVR